MEHELFANIKILDNKILLLETEKEILRINNPWYPIASISGKIGGAKAKRNKLKMLLKTNYIDKRYKNV